MEKAEYDKFGHMLAQSLAMYGRERDGAVVALWWKLLEPFAMQQIEEAFVQHLRACKFAPTPADIIGIINESDGRPTADEAWAMIPRNEEDSIFWTEEMAYAAGIARPLLNARDQVAARRAFIDAYTDAVATARRNGWPIEVTPSWGTSASGREAALIEAVNRGLLPLERAKKFSHMLPAPEVVSQMIVNAASGMKRIGAS